jgi:hypothetical protein
MCFELCAIGYVLWVICYELWVMGYVNLCGMNCVLLVLCYELCVMGYELFAMSCVLWVMWYELCVISFMLWVCVMCYANISKYAGLSNLTGKNQAGPSMFSAYQSESLVKICYLLRSGNNFLFVGLSNSVFKSRSFLQ